MQTRERPRFLAEIAHATTPNLGTVRQVLHIEVVIRDAHLPAFFSDGILYVQAPLGHVLEAVTAGFSPRLGDMEIRITTPWGWTLSLDSDGRAVHSSAMAQQSVVRDGEVT